MAISTSADGGELTRQRRLLVLGICCMSLFIVGLDSTIVNIGLPAIRTDLAASTSQLQWTIDAYTLVLASFLMLAGSTADRLGRARMFRIGLLLFGLGSALCGLAPSVGWLIAFRAMQAAGGTMLNPVAMSIIRNTFEDPRERAQAIGLWGGVIGLSMALGPVIGGALVEAAGWRAIFWVNVPVCLAAIVLTTMFVPESRAARARRPDPVGQALVIVLLASATYAIIEGLPAFWVVAAAALAGLVTYEQRRHQPLIELRFFRSPPFSGASAIAVLAFAGLGAFLFLNTLYLQEQRGYGALHAGLLTLPMAGMIVIFGPLSGRLVGARGSRPSLVVGGVFLLLGGLLLSSLAPDTSFVHLAAAYVLFGLGFGFVNPPITNTAVSGMPADQAGVAAAVASTSRQVGVTVGVALAGAVGAATGWWLIALAGGAVAVLGLLTTTPWALRTAREVAAA